MWPAGGSWMVHRITFLTCDVLTIYIVVSATQCHIKPAGDSAAVGRRPEAPDREGRIAILPATRAAHVLCSQCILFSYRNLAQCLLTIY
jgi:hypothetical protein